jgi:hypothetical protein
MVAPVFFIVIVVVRRHLIERLLSCKSSVAAFSFALISGLASEVILAVGDSAIELVWIMSYPLVTRYRPAEEQIGGIVVKLTLPLTS